MSKTALTKAEREGLPLVATVLETIPHQPGFAGASGPLEEDLSSDFQPDGPRPLRFNMTVQAAEYHCGTVACVAGMLSMHLQGIDITQGHVLLSPVQVETAEEYVNSFSNAETFRQGVEPKLLRDIPLVTRLFWPDTETMAEMGRITPQEAADAIRRTLKGEEPYPDL